MQEDPKIVTEVAEKTYFQEMMRSIADYAPKIIGAILILWIGFKVIKKIMTLFEKLLVKFHKVVVYF
jgi:hypothetical protein